jgi:hypothetical protein
MRRWYILSSTSVQSLACEQPNSSINKKSKRVQKTNVPASREIDVAVVNVGITRLTAYFVFGVGRTVVVGATKDGAAEKVCATKFFLA